MGDTTSAGLFADIFEMLSKNFDRQSEAVQRDRRQLAKSLYSKCGSFDFNDDDLEGYDALAKLGLAKICKRCKQPYTDYSSDSHGKDVCEED